MSELPASVIARLDALAADYSLSSRCVSQLGALLAGLADDSSAPTSVSDPEVAVDVHLADSLAALRLDAVRHARAIVDIGTGAGFPGIVLASALPESRVTLLDSARRKCDFAAALATRAGVSNVAVVCDRAETWADGRAAHDLATARAVGPRATVLEYAAPLLRDGATFVDWRGGREAQEEGSAHSAAHELGFVLESVRRVEPFPGARAHHLHVWRKERETPPRFPRRVGVARKRPLGG